MVSEEQKYDSSVFKNIGFAFLAPIGSIVFQAVVFKKSFWDSYIIWGIMLSVIGFILIYLGRMSVKGKNNG